MAPKVVVDWGLVDARLPTRQDPASRAERKAIFRRMDPGGNGTLTVSELQVGVPPLLDLNVTRKTAVASTSLVPIADLKPAVNCAFQCAKDVSPAKSSQKRGKAAKDTDVDMKEFHAFLVAFRNYVELAVLFQTLDKSRDLRLNFKECEGALPLLEKWGVTRKQVRDKFPDDWTESMKFSEFANWCIRSGMGSLGLKLDDSDNEEVVDRRGASILLGEAGTRVAQEKRDEDLVKTQNQRRVLELFQRLDVDKSGTISEDELAGIFVEMNKQHRQGVSPEQIRTLLASADKNKDGSLDVEEFMEWMFK